MTCFQFGFDFHLGEPISLINVERASVCRGCFRIHWMLCGIRGTGVWYSNPIVPSNYSCSNSDVKCARYRNYTKLKPSPNGD